MGEERVENLSFGTGTFYMLGEDGELHEVWQAVGEFKDVELSDPVESSEEIALKIDSNKEYEFGIVIHPLVRAKWRRFFSGTGRHRARMKAVRMAMRGQIGRNLILQYFWENNLPVENPLLEDEFRNTIELTGTPCTDFTEWFIWRIHGEKKYRIWKDYWKEKRRRTT